MVLLAATSKAGLKASGEKTWQRKPSRAAASASMRPSWPPPRMPIIEPGGSGLAAGIDVRRALRDGFRLRAPPIGEAFCERLVGGRKDRGGKEPGIGRAGLADRERPDRNARRHLHDRIKAVGAFQRARLDRDAKHRKR